MWPAVRAKRATAASCRWRSSIEEGPGICAVEAPDDDCLQQLRLEIAQVHAVPCAGLAVERLPVGDDAARFAAHISQRPITPDVLFRVLGVALDRDRAELVVGPDPCRTTAEGAVATRGLLRRSRKREANRSAMTGTVQRWF